jgi:hypothetical protein
MKNTMFQKLDLLPSSVKEAEDTYSVGSIRKSYLLLLVGWD